MQKHNKIVPKSYSYSCLCDKLSVILSLWCHSLLALERYNHVLQSSGLLGGYLTITVRKLDSPRAETFYYFIHNVDA